MIIGRQVSTDFGSRIDLLAIDSQGELNVIEIKRDRTPREVAAQTLDYGSWVMGLDYEDVTGIYAEYAKSLPSDRSGQGFEQAFAERFMASPPEALNEAHRLVIVDSELDSSTERILTYLSTRYGVPINAVFFRYFKDESHEYLTRTWLIDPNEAESSPGVTRKASPAWNGHDFYVSFGVYEGRNWEDARQYGFVSGGHGQWYSRTLETLLPGARVFVFIPNHGYVGVGTVTDPSCMIKDFQVEVDGNRTPILQAPLRATRMGEGADDPELSEYVVRVEWVKTLAVEEAIWEKGMFANRNTACKLRNPFTLERLVERFGLAE